MGKERDRVKPQYRRWIFIDEWIRSGRYPNARTLAREYEVSDKTIKRDIEYLKYSLEAPIEYDPRRRGYYYTDPNYRFSAVNVTEKDLFALYIAEKVLEQYRNTPVYSRLEDVFAQLESLLDGRVQVKTSWLIDRFSFHLEPATTIDPDDWEAVFRSLGDSRTLEFRYTAPGYVRSVERRLDPYHAVCCRGEWYVAGRCHHNGDVRIYAISRMSDARITADAFTLPADFDPEKYFGARFGIFRSEETWRVAVRFSADQAPYVRERTWHAEQEIEDQSDGGLVLRFPASHLFEVKRWVLSWGRAARALEPPELVEMVRAELDGARAGYEES